jgi:hypothetical protein
MALLDGSRWILHAKSRSYSIQSQQQKQRQQVPTLRRLQQQR